MGAGGGRGGGGDVQKGGEIRMPGREECKHWKLGSAGIRGKVSSQLLLLAPACLHTLHHGDNELTL